MIDHKWAVPASGKKIYIPSSQMKKFGNSNNNGNGNATTTGCEDNSQKIKSSSGVADEGKLVFFFFFISLFKIIIPFPLLP